MLFEKRIFKEKGINTKYYTPDIHKASFILPKNIKDEFFERELSNHILGSHITIDMAGITFEKLDDLNGLVELFDKLCIIGNLTCLNKASHKFEPQGVTSYYLLLTSHISIHTWPEYGKCCIDFFTCLEKNKFQEIIDEITSNLKPTKIIVKNLDRYV